MGLKYKSGEDALFFWMDNASSSIEAAIEILLPKLLHDTCQ